MFQYQTLRDVIKAGGQTLVKNFGEKFRELKIEGSQRKTIEALFMGQRVKKGRISKIDVEILEDESGGHH